MSEDSDFDYEYEDEEGMLISSSAAEDSEIESQTHSDCNSNFAPICSKANAGSPQNSSIDTLRNARTLKSSNSLSSMCYRSQSVSHYIYENMVRPAEILKRDYLPNFSLEEVVLMLHYKKWSADEVTSSFFEDWPRLREGSGLVESRDCINEVVFKAKFSCPICCDSGDVDIFYLSCGHEFCASCYKQYVVSNISRGAIIRCMDLKCNYSLPYSAITQLLAVESTDSEETEKSGVCSNVTSGTQTPHERYEDLRAELYSDDDALEEKDMDEYDLEFEKNSLTFSLACSINDTIELEQPLIKNVLLVSAARVSIDTSRSRFRWCPAVDCSQLVESVLGFESYESRPLSTASHTPENNDLSQISMVTCANDHEFCFDCHHENHLPCPCWIAKAWTKRCMDDTETVNWIDANTQACPECQAIIEKNGGCNHMSCGTCKYEFCWICLGDWKLHGQNNYKCNRFDAKEVEELKKKRSDKQNSLSRYLHFYRRFAVHQVSIKGDQKTHQLVHRCMLRYMKAQTLSSERAGSWNDVQFLSDAIRSLNRGRKTLMWTYAFAFYLTKSNYSEIFEGMQDFLNKTVEDLSLLFECIKVMDSPEQTALKISKRKAEIISLASLVSRRRELLIESARTGLQQGSLSFFTP